MSEETIKRVMVEWREHGRHGWVGEITGYEETPIGPLVRVSFSNGESGLYEHEYLRVVPAPRRK